MQNVYSPTHAITLKRTGRQGSDVSASTRTRACSTRISSSSIARQQGHRPDAADAPADYPPRTATSRCSSRREWRFRRTYQVPRDVVLVLDTSGSMRGVKMEQAKKALKYCLGNLSTADRFAIDQLRHHGRIPTATNWSTANAEQVDNAQEMGRQPGSDRRHRHRRRTRQSRWRLRAQGRGPFVYHRLLHRRCSRRSAKPSRTRSSRTLRCQATRPTRASSRSASATTSTPRCSTVSPSRRVRSAPTFVPPRTSRQR